MDEASFVSKQPSDNCVFVTIFFIQIIPKKNNDNVLRTWYLQYYKIDCKQKRRKCERTKDSESCRRCVRLKKPCISYKTRFKPTIQEDTVDNSSNELLEVMCPQIDQLEDAIQALQLQIQTAKQNKAEPSWQLEWMDGRLLLQTDITCMDELIQYASAFSRYLSPFGHTWSRQSLVYQPLQTHTALMTALTILRTQCRYKLIKPKHTPPSMHHVRSHRPELLVYPLIDLYFQCYTDHLPLFHEPSFRIYLSSLKNPLEDPVTLALCAAASVLTCPHAIFQHPSEKRFMADYFCERTIQVMEAMYDDPARALEVLICFNLLQPVMRIALELDSLRRWHALVIVLIVVLEHQLSKPAKDRESRIRQAVIHRNIATVQCNSYFIDMLNDRQIRNKRLSIVFDVLPDESEKAKGLIDTQNHLDRLRQTPLHARIYSQIATTRAPSRFQFDLEEIVMYEDVVQQWWRGLPKTHKITDQLFNLTLETVHACTDFRQLLIALYAIDAVLFPSGYFMQANHGIDTNSLLYFAMKRSAHMFQYLESIYFGLLKQLDQFGFCFPCQHLLIRSIDQLTKLVNAKDSTMTPLYQAILKKQMDQLKAWSSSDQFVPSTKSPFALVSNIPPPKLKLSLNELYEDYPLTGKAMMFDIIQTMVHPLIQKGA
ncbi:hypothetical protein BD560DRAFT_426918 [Blakeslea trispora]|nr:hypothetical protein BD560DRAFT_426918 [Blakeslea trispora]